MTSIFKKSLLVAAVALTSNASLGFVSSASAQSITDGYFRLTTQFREGHNECLEGNQRNGSMNGAAFMDTCQNVTGQMWKSIPLGDGYYKLVTQFREGEGECLEGNQRNGSMNGAAFMDACQNVTGQMWKAIPVN